MSPTHPSPYFWESAACDWNVYATYLAKFRHKRFANKERVEVETNLLSLP
jgi:hypothetical protein